MKHTIGRTVGVLVMSLALPSAAWAQASAGIRAGVSGTPDQFFFGGHIETGQIADHLTFRPNVEVGVGNGETLVCVNLEFAYHVPLHRQPWTLYFSAGPAAIISSPSRPNGSNVGGGFNLLVGLQARQGFFTELKAGLIDSPEIKFTVGYAFRGR